MKTIFLLEDLYDRYGDRDGYKLVIYETAKDEEDALVKISLRKKKFPWLKFIILDVI